MDGQALVLRLNISDQVGKDFRKEYNLDLVPSFLVFDKYGNESFRKKLRIPEAFEVLELIEYIYFNNNVKIIRNYSLLELY